MKPKYVQVEIDSVSYMWACGPLNQLESIEEGLKAGDVRVMAGHLMRVRSVTLAHDILPVVSWELHKENGEVTNEEVRQFHHDLFRKVHQWFYRELQRFVSSTESGETGGQSNSCGPDEPPPVSLDAVKFMQLMGFRLIGWDPNGRGFYVVWRRGPTAQGDSTTCEFLTSVGIQVDRHFLLTIADVVLESGVRAGRRALRRDVNELLNDEAGNKHEL